MPLSGPQSSVVNVFTSGSLTTPLQVTSSQTSPVWVSGTVEVAIPPISVLESSVGLTGALAPSSATLVAGLESNSLNLIPLKVDNSGALWITGTFSTEGSVQHVTGTVAIDVSSVPLGVSGTVGVIGTVSVSATNLPMTQSVSWLPTQIVTSSISNFPSGFNVNVTASVPLQVTASISNLPVTQSVKIDQTIVLPVTMSTSQVTAIWVTGSTGGTSQVTASISNFPTGFNANITGSIPLQVTASVPNLTASISNFPVTQSVVALLTGSSITLPVTMSTTQTTAIWVTGSTGGTSQITASIPSTVTVTASAANPVQITGTTHFDNTSIAVTFVSQSVTGNISVTNLVAVSQSTTAGTAIWTTGTHGVSGIVSVTSTVTNPIWITGSAFQTNIPVTQSVVAQITGSIPLNVTSTVINPVWITGTLASSTDPAEGVPGGASPAQAIQIGLAQPGGFLRAWKGESDGTGWITGTVSIGSAPLTTITGTTHFDNTSIAVTATAANPVWVIVSGNMSASFVGTLLVSGAYSGSSSGTILTGAIQTIAGIHGYSDTLGLYRPIRAEGTNADAEAVIDASLSGSALILSAEAYNKNFNGATWDRQRGDISGTWVKTVSGTMLSVTSTVANPVTVTGTVFVANATIPILQGGTFNTNLLSTAAAYVTSTIAGPVWATGTVSIGNVIPTHGVTFVSQSVTGTVSIGNTVPVTFVSQSVTGNISVTNLVAVTSTVANPVQMTGTVFVANAASIGGGLQYGTGSVQPMTGTLMLAMKESDNTAQVVKTDANRVLLVNMVSGTIPAASNPSIGGTGSASPFTASLIAGNNAGTLVPISSSVDGRLFVSSTAANPVSVTGVIGISGPITFVSQSVTGTISIGNTVPVTFVSQSVTGNISVTNLVAVTSTVANPVQMTGTVFVGNTSLSVTFISQSVTGTVSVGNIPQVTFVSQSVTGNISITNTPAVTMSTNVGSAVWVTGTVSVVPSTTSGGGSQYVTGTISGSATTGTVALFMKENDSTLNFAKTDANRVLLVNMVSGTTSSTNTSVGGTGSLAPFSASLVGLKDDAGNIRPLSGSSNGVLYVAISGAIDAVFSGTQIVTSTLANPVFVTGVIGVSGPITFVSQSVTGNISVTNLVAVTSTVANPVQMTGTVFVGNTSLAVTFISQSVTGTVSIGNVIPTHGVTFVSQSVTGTVSIGNTVPVTFISQSITGTVSIGNAIPTHGVTFVSQSVTGNISVTNLVAVTSTVANPVQITGTVAINATPINVTSTVASPVFAVVRSPPTNPPTIVVLTASSTSQQLFAANANRIGVTIQNFAASNAIFVNLNTSVAAYNSATVRLAGNGYYEMPFRYTGSIQVAASGVQTAICIGQEFIA